MPIGLRQIAWNEAVQHMFARQLILQDRHRVVDRE
jgi:hypothetical protein